MNKEQPNWVIEYNNNNPKQILTITHVHEWVIEALFKGNVKVYRCRCGARKTVTNDRVQIDYLDGGIVC